MSWNRLAIAVNIDLRSLNIWDFNSLKIFPNWEHQNSRARRHVALRWQVPAFGFAELGLPSPSLSDSRASCMSCHVKYSELPVLCRQGSCTIRLSIRKRRRPLRETFRIYSFMVLQELVKRPASWPSSVPFTGTALKRCALPYQATHVSCDTYSAEHGT